MKEIVTDSYDFEALVTSKDIIYVDKTAYVAKMVMSRSRFFFISRPRRFGKSLMCSTLDALFSGKKELFSNLYIGGTDYDFKAYPVLRFDFSKLNATSYQSFLSTFRKEIRNNAKANRLDIVDDEPSSMLDDLIGGLENPVIIIDEFDSPVIDAVSEGSQELAEKMQRDFNAFYKVIKSCTGKIRFLFITGCTKLSGLSIFSALNNLNDISLDPDYAGMSGYTEEELVRYFSEHIGQKLSMPESPYSSKEEFLDALRNYYDGYRFSDCSEVKVYNPVSIGKYFTVRKLPFSNYWISTGGLSTLAVTLGRNVDLLSIVEERRRIAKEELTSFDIFQIASAAVPDAAVAALLYYAGYLTLTGSDDYTFTLDFPNTEVRAIFLEAIA